MGRRTITDDEVVGAVADLRQHSGRVTITALAERIGLSRNATWVRARRLVDTGRLIDTAGTHASWRLPDPDSDLLVLTVTVRDGRVVDYSTRYLNPGADPH